ncbi:MAG: hypothetical protein ABJC10_03400 [Acidobacteriota bacterium]
MKNENDYLWDKTEEPDPEIQQLEEILGTLRYQPRPLRIPAELRTERERTFFRSSAARLAVAATIVLLLLGLGVWLGLQRLQRSQPQIVKNRDAETKTNSAIAPTDEHGSSRVALPSVEPKHKAIGGPHRRGFNQILLTANSNRRRNASIRNQYLVARRQKEAEAAKDQLMLALRLTSAKLNFAQKKTLNSRDEIHNQHKIG